MSSPIEVIQLKPLDEAIIDLMKNRGLNTLEQVGLLQLIIYDISNELTDETKLNKQEG